MGVKVKMDSTDKILGKRKLHKGGEAQIYFTKQCAKWMNNYIPYDTGRLKDMDIEIGTDFVKYNAPYAKKQYYTNSGKGKKNKVGIRGKFWDKKMWADKSKTIIKALADFVGGKGK